MACRPFSRLLRRSAHGGSARAPRVARFVSATLALSAALVFGGCEGAESFRLEPGETYCGSLVYTPAFTDGLLPDNARPPTIRMRFDLDVDHLSTLPGTLRTDDKGHGLCSEDGKPLFADAPLRTIEPVLHDPISQAIIGEGRDQNYFTYVSSSCGHQMMAVVSLMHSGGVEVRLFKPAAAPPDGADEAQKPGFGLFTLERKNEKNCSF